MTVKTARTDLAALLSAAIGTPVLPSVPDTLDGPGIALQPGDPYLEVGDNNAPWPFTHLEPEDREVRVHLEAVVFVEPTDNAVDLDKVDELLAALLAAMPKAWQVDSVGTAEAISTADWTTYGVIVHLSTIVPLQA